MPSLKYRTREILYSLLITFTSDFLKLSLMILLRNCNEAKSISILELSFEIKRSINVGNRVEIKRRRFKGAFEEGIIFKDAISEAFE